jgi:hypothetical protein
MRIAGVSVKRNRGVPGQKRTPLEETMTGALRTILVLILAALGAAPDAASAAPTHYKNFRVAIYVAVGSTRHLADPTVAQKEFDRAMRQTHFDKVYLEVYRDRQFASDEEIETVKRFFQSRGIQVSGGVTLAAGNNKGQFGTFDYENPADREECRKAAALAARHFDEVVLDDFFFTTSKSDADIAAKGSRSWTQYRLDLMRSVAAELVLKPAKEANPRVRMIIKYPNWYEHFQGLGFDLETESHLFDAIYTGTESRDPDLTDQLLQQYESYSIFRYYSNIRPNGGDLGGWVDTYSTRSVDRYAEQLWDTLFAKAPEITLFNWTPMVEDKAVAPGNRDGWKDKPTSFRWDDMVNDCRRGGGEGAPGWGQVAGYSLGLVDKVVGELGHPLGIPSYKPYQSTGEDFLQNYLGNIGIPIEMTPDFPTGAEMVLLTEQAKFDPDIVAKIKGQLTAGKSVVMTSGLLGALQGRGIEDVVEWSLTGRIAAIHDFLDGYGAGNGTPLNDPVRDNPSILFPEIHFYTNDSWAVVRGAAAEKGFPILLMNRYSAGVIYVLAVPENMGDLYNLPVAVLKALRTVVTRPLPVRIDAPSKVSLFVYDNGRFVIESYRDGETKVEIAVAGGRKSIRNLATGERLAEADQGGGVFRLTVQPHSFMAFAAEN